MPELPEVETVKSVIEPQVAGRTIERVAVRRPEVIAHPDAEAFCRRLAGQVFAGMARRGKFLVFHLASGGHVLLHGRLAPIVGRICMDLTFVDVTDLPPVAAGDIATLIGTDGGQTITALDLARQSGTLSNEILSRLGTRLERYLS